MAKRISKTIVAFFAIFLFSFSTVGAVGVQTSMIDGLIQNYILRRNETIGIESVVNISHSIIYHASQYGVDPLLTAAMIAIESNFNQDAISSVGAIGLTQLMPSTAEAVGVNPYDADQNIEGGCSYLATQIRNFQYMETPTECALAAYNAGPNAVHQYGGIPPYSETQNYVENIREEYFLLYDSLMYALG